MSLNDQQTNEASERYSREVDRYRKLADLVFEKCQDIVQKKLTIRATVQRRAKDPKSFSDKIRKPKIKNKYDSVDDLFKGISDLAGVRIITYLESDRKLVVDEIKKEFIGASDGSPVIDVKDKDESGKHYRATHCQVYLPEEYLAGSNENLRGTTCEIQVCSILAHVFNEIEHDLQYKPLSGEISEGEQDLLNQLGFMTKSGDITIKKLLDEADNRLKVTNGEFADVHDFVIRMKDNLKIGSTFSQYAGQLYDELNRLNLNSPQRIISELLDTGEDLKQVATSVFIELKTYIETKDWDIDLEDNTSDLLLCVLLRKKYEDVNLNHPTGRGLGRPGRLTRIAMSYRQMMDERRRDSSVVFN